MDLTYPTAEKRNASSAQRAQDLVSRYSSAYKSDDDQQALSDLLADMLHLTFLRGDMDFDEAIRCAEMHFTAELEEELTPP